MATLVPLLPSTAELQGSRTAPCECGRSGTAALCCLALPAACPAQKNDPKPGVPLQGGARDGDTRGSERVPNHARADPRSPARLSAGRGRPGAGGAGAPQSPRTWQRSPARNGRRRKLVGRKAKAPRPADPGLRPAEPPSRPPPVPGCALLPGAAAARPLPAHQTVP